MTKSPNLYEILGLSSPSNSLASPHSIATLKAAYHRALLTHHPDKSSRTASASSTSVDAIKSAYTVLSDPTSRASYDQELLLSNQRITTASDALTGEERVDLDDIAYDALTKSYFRACRCGEARGHEVSEEDLEVEAAGGAREVLVQCGGCSLWLRIEFAIVDDHAGLDQYGVSPSDVFASRGGEGEG